MHARRETFTKLSLPGVRFIAGGGLLPLGPPDALGLTDATSNIAGFASVCVGVACADFEVLGVQERATTTHATTKGTLTDASYCQECSGPSFRRARMNSIGSLWQQAGALSRIRGSSTTECRDVGSPRAHARRDRQPRDGC